MLTKLLVAHVVLGALQSDTNVALAVLLGIGLLTVSVLHLLAAARNGESTMQEFAPPATRFEVYDVSAISEKRAKAISIGGERVAFPTELSAKTLNLFHTTYARRAGYPDDAPEMRQRGISRPVFNEFCDVFLIQADSCENRRRVPG